MLESQNRLAGYRPYAKQREFHAVGAGFRERLLKAANQTGKSYCAACEVGFHVTGEYPDWWEGKRFARANHWLAGSETGELTRRGVQRYLLGRDPKTDIGTGSIPKRLIVGATWARGVASLVDTVSVRHVSGGVSTISLKSYDQGRARWQADTVDGIWFDEEPPEDVYFEGVTRTNVSEGPILLTFTPLKGYSRVIMRFLEERAPGTHVTTMTLFDAEHYTPEARERIIATYPAHERPARVYGDPALGEGAVFPIEDEVFVVPPFDIPDHWPRIVGLDFGWDHLTAACWLAFDRDTDTVYLYDEYAQSKALVPVHASAIKAKGEWVPVAWPRDGLNDTAVGPQLAKQYRDEGVNMLQDFAQFEATGIVSSEAVTSRVSVEAGLHEMLTRMGTGRFKVFSTCQGWLAEKRLYRREKGKVIKLGEDRISASRYGLVMLRFATTKPVAGANRIDYAARAGSRRKVW